MSAGKAQLADAAKKLHAAWREARTRWDDDAARAFEKRYLEPLPGALRRASQAMDALDEAIASARRSCS